MTVSALKNGDDFVKRFFTEQAPVLFREPRQGAEMVARGQAAVCIGTTTPVVADFEKQGIKNLKRILPEDMSYLFMDTLWLMDRAPHPNAAKLYINWVLTKAAQDIYAKGTAQNSRRKDVAPAAPAILPPEGADKRFVNMLHQEKYNETERVRAMTRDLLK